MNITSTLKKIVESEIASHLPSSPRRLLVALSGGADSVATLSLLQQIPDTYIEAVHCNFHLRGEESNRDESFCIDLCNSLNIPLYVHHFDVEDYQHTNGGSVEMACRALRYELFASLCRDKDMMRIVTGHNANDNAETLLLNLMRGAGAKGLSAMTADNGFVLRPLLAITRKEILSYLHSQHLSWVEDHTNASSEYRRNFLRNEVIPLLQKEWPESIASINKSAQALSGEYLSLSHNIPSSDFIPWYSLLNAPDIVTLLVYSLRDFPVSISIINEIAAVISKFKESEATHTSLLIGKQWRPDDSYIILFERDGLHIVDAEKLQSSNMLFSPEEVGFTSYRLMVNDDLLQHIKREADNNKLYLPTPIASQIQFRHPQPRDKFSPLGMKGSRLVGDILKEAGLTRVQRAQFFLAVDDDDNVIWLPGIRRSRLHLLSPADSIATLISLAK